MPIGKCKLCLREGVELQKSHFLPAGGYKLIQSFDGSPPVVTKDGIAIQTNEQITAHILCSECEERFNKNGEDWVMRYCKRHHEGFRLIELIAGASPMTPPGAPMRAYSTRAIPEIDMNKLVYFGASVLWRGSVHNWKMLNRDVVSPKIMYEEAFRKYLLGVGEFSRAVTVWVHLIENEELQHLVIPPYGRMSSDYYWKYWFVFLGIHYMFALGHLIPPNFRNLCSLRSYERFIYASEGIGDAVVRDFGPKLVSARRVGKLKK